MKRPDLGVAARRDESTEYLPRLGVGIHQAVPFPEYLSLDYVSSSGCCNMIEGGPLYFRERRSVHSPSMELGTDLHCCLLEPDRWLGGVACEYETTADNWASNPGRAERKDILERGLRPIKEKDALFCDTTRTAVLGHPYAGGIYRASDLREVSIVVDLGELDPRWKGHLAKIRLDLGSTKVGMITDLKSGAPTNFRPQGFRAQVWRMKYHLKAAFYVDVAKAAGLPVDWYSWVVVRNEEPVEVACYRCPENWLRLGREEYLWAVDRIISCREAGEFPSPYDDLVDLRGPDAWQETASEEGPSWAIKGSSSVESPDQEQE